MPVDVIPPPFPQPAAPAFQSSPSPSMFLTPPAPTSPSPETLLVQGLPPPPSSVTPIPLTVPVLPSPSPESFTPPFPPFAVSQSPPAPITASQPLPFPYATAPSTTSFPPFAVAPSPPSPTADFPPALPDMPLTPEAAAVTTSSFPPPPLPPSFTREPTLATPWSPALPLSAPQEVNLPVAVNFQKTSTFHVASGLIVGLVIGAIVLVFGFSIGLLLCRNRKKNKQKNLCTGRTKESPPSIESKGSHVIRVPSNPTLPPNLTSGSFKSVSVKTIPNHAPRAAFSPGNGSFRYDEILAATNCFSESNLLGEGGFGYVYKGVLPCGKQIAVKQLKLGSQQGEREFQAEVETISRVHHKHLVELVGYCVAGAERMLVYEFVPNNTLEFHLHGEGSIFLGWTTRIKIAVGSAKGLAYLHEDCNPAIIHRDIKASNILLDFKFEPKVSDFGLAKVLPNNDSHISHLTTRVMGTFGYVAPEYASSGKLTDKSDVYSYGVMLLELITGRPPITAAGSRNESLVDWARPLLARALQEDSFDNLVDPRLQKNYEADEMVRMITCAAACVRHSSRLRPRMSQIVGALEGVVSLTDLVGDVTPENTPERNWSNYLDYGDNQYQYELRSFNLALPAQKYSSSGYSETTSACGLYSSGSSSEAHGSFREIL
ncbi:serine/threonine-protein kinase PBS1 [Vigna unguiculata]|uniref:non-specific serine/threonine protein kinase n=2 Tax=Vigna unguiculata TaxID=3917 RepID=A0A4D6NT42_VIGUN|nr:serine/threonine-protein kinase PBS1 [Vigna unguiculata]